MLSEVEKLQYVTRGALRDLELARLVLRKHPAFKSDARLSMVYAQINIASARLQPTQGELYVR
jgi:hypothetical protein